MSFYRLPFYFYVIVGIFIGSFANNVYSEPFFKTTSEATKVAEQKGYVKTNFISKGQPVYKANTPVSGVIKGLTYITPDVDSHNGGAWKAAKNVEGLNSKSTRLGTYNKDLTKRIGD